MLKIDDEFITFSSGYQIPSWAGINVAWKEHPINPDQSGMEVIPYDHYLLSRKDREELADTMIEFWTKEKERTSP